MFWLGTGIQIRLCHRIRGLSLRGLRLSPFTTILQLYHDGQLYREDTGA